MPLTKIATELARLDRYATSDFALKSQFFEERPATVSAILGVPLTDVERMLAGRSNPDMFRVAYHYGFMPDTERDCWRTLPMSEEPFDAGPYMQWTEKLVEYLRRVLGNPLGRPPVRELAWRMDTTESRLRYVIRRRTIVLGPNVRSVLERKASLLIAA